MSTCYASWGKKTLTFQQLEDVLNMWFLETEEEERVFHRMAEELRYRDQFIQYNQYKVGDILQTCRELQIAQKVIGCQVFDLCCDLKPLEDTICCLELLTCNTHLVDCQKLSLYCMVECLFAKVNQISLLAEDLALLSQTQEVIAKITKILSLDEKCLNGLLKKIEFVENEVLKIVEEHSRFPAVLQL